MLDFLGIGTKRITIKLELVLTNGSYSITQI